MPTREEFLGRGLTVPLQLTGRGLAESAGVDKVEESMRVVLGTQHGERVMRPQFGCGLGRLAFAPNDTATASLARYYVTEGLTRWEPRIEVVAVEVVNDPPLGRLLITIDYRLRASRDSRSLIYPFYLERNR